MSKRRKYDGKSKRGLIIILLVSIVIVGVFSLFIYRYSKASKIKYVIEAGSVIQDINRNYLTIDNDAELRIRWNGNYYLIYNDKNVNLGKKVITYNTITDGMKLYGTFYEIKSDGKIQEYHNETRLANTTNSKFYKLDDREYLLVDSKISSEDYSVEATGYLLVELDKLGNAKLSNNKLNLKTISPTKLVTSDYIFDIANEVLKFGEYNIDLKKIIGSTNQYVPEEVKPEKDKPTVVPGTGTGTGTGSGNGNGTGSGSSDVINGVENEKLPPVTDLLDKVKMTSIIRIVEGITQIDVDYVIYDPYNEYGSVYVEVVSPDKIDVIQLSKTENHLSLTNLLANTEYRLNFIYTISKTNAETGEVDTVTNTFESFLLKTKMPEYSVSVYKISKVYNTLTYKVDLQSGYSISKVNVEMTFNHMVLDEETGAEKEEVATLEGSVSVPEGGAKYVNGTFDISGYDLTSDTLLKLTVKSVNVTEEYVLPINSAYTFRFGR